MKQIPNVKRSRNFRGNGRRPNFSGGGGGGGGNGGGGGRNQTFESSGPEGKIRGSAYQVIDRYQALARDALSSGDRVAAENYLQHAEHYYRVLAVNGIEPRPQRFQQDGTPEEQQQSATSTEQPQSDAPREPGEEPPAQPA
jgi:hypothetical protein